MERNSAYYCGRLHGGQRSADLNGRADQAVPRAYLKLEQAIQFTDADGDGEDELVASDGGTVPNTSLIAATNNGGFMTVKLNDVLGTNVYYDNSQKIFVASTGTNQTDRYKLQAGELVKLR